jgi:hypothetical protein
MPHSSTRRHDPVECGPEYLWLSLRAWSAFASCLDVYNVLYAGPQSAGKNRAKPIHSRQKPSRVLRLLQQPHDPPLAQAAFTTACLQPLLGKSLAKPELTNESQPSVFNAAPACSSNTSKHVSHRPGRKDSHGTYREEHACGPTPEEKISAATTVASLRAFLPLDARAAWASPECAAGRHEVAGVKCTEPLLSQLQV